MPTATVSKPTSAKEAFGLKGDPISTDAKRVFDALDKVLPLLIKKMESLGNMNGESRYVVGFLVPGLSPAGAEGNCHGLATRLEVDLGLPEEIREEVSNYAGNVKNAVESLWQTADGLSWSGEKCDRMLSAMERDARRHTDAVILLLETSTRKFDGAGSYVAIVADATTLRLHLKLMNEHLKEHLENVARSAELRRA